MLSPIQLVEHKILRIHFDTRKIEGDSAEMIFSHAISASPQNEEGTKWLVRLDVQFKPDPNKNDVPYIGEIAVVGAFTLPDDFPKDKASEMVHVNGGAILYGTVRELLTSITSRGIHGSVMLPTVNAGCFLPKPAEGEEA
jgi:preprotein translocase subunit SecB